MFLHRLLPEEGMYCVAQLLPSGGFRHFFFEDLDSAVLQIKMLDKNGNTTYITQATYDPEKIREAQAHNKQIPYGLPKPEYKALARKTRSQDNARYLKNFFLDIDCGEKWPLKNQSEGCKALQQFVTETGLPMPAVINSGNGLYAHWILDQAIPAPQWQTVAYLLKKVVAAYSPAIGGDSTRTSDTASVLRIPGTTNRKPGREPKPVTILHDPNKDIAFEDFAAKLRAAAKAKKVKHDALLPPKANKDVNAEFFVYEESINDANLIAAKCAQVGLMRSTGGNIPEPLWYSCIGILVHCINGEEIIHEWSQGHSGYSTTQTDDKILQWRTAGVGPTTCAKLGSENPQTCIGCPHNGKIKSPIVLGRPEPVKAEVPVTTCDTPPGYRRSKDGLFAEEEGRWVKFYDMDLYLERLAYDESLGYEVMTIKHHLPHEGALECTLRSSLVHDPKALMTILADSHIKVVGAKEKKHMLGYIESYQAKLQRHQKMTKLLCQMGWKDLDTASPMFVHGKKIYHSNGAVEEASLARNVPKSAEGFRQAGSLEKWTEATEILGRPGMEPFAFALLASFGAPLMPFTGFDGALVSLVGDSGAGKTLMLRWNQSVWGYHNDLMMLRDDTKNALVSRLGVYGNLPLVVDEVTNMPGIEISDFVYKVTQGRDKARLTKNSEERKLINSWNTLAVTSSNASLIDKLSELKHDASAEINRVFEYPVPEMTCFKGQTATQAYWTIHENYGHAGEIYAKWLVKNVDVVKIAIEKMREKIDLRAKTRGDERYWSAVASASLVGGAIAKSLGLIKFNVVDPMEWVISVIRNMRGDKDDLAGDAIGILGQFLDEHAHNRLLVKGITSTRLPCLIVEAPRGPLVIRYEVENDLLFISRAAFKTWIAKRFGSYSGVRKELEAKKILLSGNAHKALGSGTTYDSMRQPVWTINMKSPHLGGVIQELKEVGTLLAKADMKSAGAMKL